MAETEREIQEARIVELLDALTATQEELARVKRREEELMHDLKVTTEGYELAEAEVKDLRERYIPELERNHATECELMVERFEARVAKLREALEGEWLMNHDERCTNMENCQSFGGEKRCYHPRPAALEDTP